MGRFAQYVTPESEGKENAIFSDGNVQGLASLK